MELKEPKTYEEQLAIFERRGMIINDRPTALRFLEYNNYYRVNGYAFQFMNQKDKYKKGLTFDTIMALYSFDQKLRVLFFSALESIEVYARTQIAYEFSHMHGKEGHYNSANFKRADYHTDFISTLNRQMVKNKHAAFVAHHCSKYDGKMPLWCAVEILPFSTLSKLFANMLDRDRNVIAEKMAVKAAYLSNWLHCFSVLRNTCAHYGRIYNTIASPPIKLGNRTLRKYPQVKQDSIFAYIIAMLRIIPEEEKRVQLGRDILDLLIEYREIIDFGLLGFPEDWHTLLFDSFLMGTGL